MNKVDLKELFLERYKAKYLFRRNLKPGAEGQVFVAEERATGVEVVVKLPQNATINQERRFRVPRLLRSPQYVDLITVEPLAVGKSTVHAIVSRFVPGVEWGLFLERLNAMGDDVETVRKDEVIIAACASLVDAVGSLHEEGFAHGALSDRNVMVSIRTDGRVSPFVVLVDLKADANGLHEEALKALDLIFLRKMVESAISKTDDGRLCKACLPSCVGLPPLRALLGVSEMFVRFAPQKGAGVETRARAAARILSTVGMMSIVDLASSWSPAFYENVYPLYGLERGDATLASVLDEEAANVRVKGTGETSHGPTEALLRSLFVERCDIRENHS